jgi:tetratricopeptide (TPR) repeat protein
VRGRCVSYGEGITYWPIVPVLRQLEPRFPHLSLDERVVATLHGLLGSEATMDSTEEIAFAVRKLLEAAAREQPLVCVFDDIQWGEPAFLELIEQVTALSRDAPLLLCCIARADLLERHPGWGGGHLATTIALDGLTHDEMDTLIDHVSGETPPPAPLRERIRETADGNPLFVEEMIGLLRDTAADDVRVPSTIQALLASRLDQLDPAERAVLQCGAIGGRTFHHGAVQLLAPDETQLGSRLAALVRKELIRPDTPQFPGEEAYRFRHLLIRDAAYETLPKAARAELHERFAEWLGPHASALVEPDEVLGYHLEQAYSYRIQLRPLDARTRDLGRRASELIAAVGTRALGRNDIAAASKLLTRALALCPEDDPAVALRLDLSHALLSSGEFVAACDMAEDAATRAAAAGDQAAELRARLAVARMAVQVPREDDAEEPSAQLLALAAQARPVFARADDEVGLTDAWVATAWAELIRCRWSAMLEAVEHALEHARRSSYIRWERELPAWKGTALFYGPTPVDDVLRWYEQEPSQHPMALNQRAVLEAMRGRFDEARTWLAAADALAEDLGQTVWRAAGGISAWEVETLAGDASAAERSARAACQLLEQLGDTAYRSLAAGQLAASLFALDRRDEADRWTLTAEELATGDDVVSNMLWRQVRAKLLACRGEHADAERLAHEAVGLAEGTDMLTWHAHALTDLADVYARAGRSQQAIAQLEHALELFESKGNLVAAARGRTALTELQDGGRLVSQPATD